MPSLPTFLLVALSATALKATNTAGDPTDLASPVASNVASYPATITANSIASAILATTTPLAGSDLGNGANIVDYPECAQFCGNQSVAVANCNVETLDCACGANYLSIAAACEQVVCNASDRAASQVLANQFYDPLFQNFPSLGSAASAAVASATAAAAAVASRDPTLIASYPLCAQKCQNASTLFPTCGSLANRACVCSLNTTDGSCEKATCNAADFQTTLDLANSLCRPVGGFGDPYNASATATAAPSVASNRTTATPSPIAFTGNAITVVTPWLGWIVIGLFGLAGWQAVL